ncbi:uncharacterized protein MELLADRAFT_61202 [Melampsora larici-populina 98AG31]|uniref:Uncharacterized protein n=1 Tax=Melampsora larici-populina (strain 98AG31 / pathotype 3-4-7) TaxID=747676 RepID=F4RDZ7_MELLP|nr:uncharacterized protein MELLADRAFT_61202 [Melampsora larici-populina 98AG31]EGG09527.1 hypothetical protein MELLADRAFT_61202 [Melampsora larici-populina 98AG31]
MKTQVSRRPSGVTRHVLIKSPLRKRASEARKWIGIPRLDLCSQCRDFSLLTILFLVYFLPASRFRLRRFPGGSQLKNTPPNTDLPNPIDTARLDGTRVGFRTPHHSPQSSTPSSSTQSSTGTLQVTLFKSNHTESTPSSPIHMVDLNTDLDSSILDSPAASNPTHLGCTTLYRSASCAALHADHMTRSNRRPRAASAPVLQQSYSEISLEQASSVEPLQHASSQRSHRPIYLDFTTPHIATYSLSDVLNSSDISVALDLSLTSSAISLMSIDRFTLEPPLESRVIGQRAHKRSRSLSECVLTNNHDWSRDRPEKRRRISSEADIHACEGDFRKRCVSVSAYEQLEEPAHKRQRPIMGLM